MKREGFCWEVYNVDQQNYRGLLSLVPNSTAVITTMDPFHTNPGQRVCAIHMGRNSWELTDEHRPVWFDTRDLKDAWKLIMEYVDGTNCVIVSIRHEFRNALEGKYHQLPHMSGRHTHVSHTIVANGASDHLVDSVRRGFYQGRVPISKFSDFRFNTVVDEECLERNLVRA